MKAIIAGATGATGRCLTEQLLQLSEYTHITVLVRRRYFPPHPKLKEVVVNFDKLENYAEEISGDIAFSCLGTTLRAAGGKDAQWKIDYEYQYKFATLASKNKIPSFVLLSAMGANEKSTIFYSKMKGALERKIEALQFPHLEIFQPGPLIRPGSDRKGEKISLAIIQFLNRLYILRKYRPIHVQALARAMIIKSGKYPAVPIEIISSEHIFNILDTEDNN